MLMKAKDARQLVEKRKKEKIQEQLNSIIEEINIAIDNEEYCTTISGNIYEENRNILQEYGYTLSFTDKYDEIDTIIKW